MVIAGKEYGTGSSRDWAAKGTRLLGIRVVIAESFEEFTVQIWLEWGFTTSNGEY